MIMDDQEKLIQVEKKVGDIIYWLLIICAIAWPVYTLW